MEYEYTEVENAVSIIKCDTGGYIIKPGNRIEVDHYSFVCSTRGEMIEKVIELFTPKV